MRKTGKPEKRVPDWSGKTRVMIKGEAQAVRGDSLRITKHFTHKELQR